MVFVLSVSKHAGNKSDTELRKGIRLIRKKGLRILRKLEVWNGRRWCSKKSEIKCKEVQGQRLRKSSNKKMNTQNSTWKCTTE